MWVMYKTMKEVEVNPRIHCGIVGCDEIAAFRYSESEDGRPVFATFYCAKDVGAAAIMDGVTIEFR